MFSHGRHSRESGNPFCFDAKANMDSRFRGNDGLMDNFKIRVQANAAYSSFVPAHAHAMLPSAR
ncbi:hypothetical protein GCM10007902_33340 [Dyella nitratireducens]|nr:hypothetical protein GCM10007902_33340 [Dyella nitratireducens]